MAFPPLPPTPIIRPMPDPNLCVLIDFENIAAGTEKAQLGKFNIHSVLNRLKERGRILISRAYGDWGRFAKFKQDLLREGVSMMELTSYRGQDKNRADIALVVDAMELAFTREHIDTYVLLSGDSDFTPLVMKLREFNKRVIGVGTRQSTSRLLSAACDEFIFYENIRRGHSNTDSSEEEDVIRLTKVEAFAKLVETLEGLVRDTSGPVTSGVLKQSLLRKVPTFDEAEFGYSGFARFLESAKNKGLIRIHDDIRAGGYLVSLSGSGPQEPPPPTVKFPPLSDEAERLRDILIANNANPTTHLMRHVLVHELVDHVQERAARKKRNTLFYLYGDMNRRCRKTDPMVPTDLVRSIIDTLHAAGTILHPDGNPVRSPKANFVIQHDPEEILNKLRDHYIRVLLRTGESLGNSIALSELLWGDAEHQLEVEQALSWVQLEEEQARQAEGENQSSAPDTPAPPQESTDTTEPASETTEPEEKPKRRRRRTKKAAETETSDSSTTPTEKPKRRRRTKKTTESADSASPTDATSESAPATTEPASETTEPEEKPKRRRRRTKKTAEPADSASPTDATSESAPATTEPASETTESEEKPKRRRRRTKKAAEAETETSDSSTTPTEKPKRRRRTKKTTESDAD